MSLACVVLLLIEGAYLFKGDSDSHLSLLRLFNVFFLFALSVSGEMVDLLSGLDALSLLLSSLS